MYGITTAAELVGMGAQTLRAYETHGLLTPDRTPGGTRRYSADDLDRLRRIGDLLAAGLNLAGVGMVLNLEADNTHRLKSALPTTPPQVSAPRTVAPPSPMSRQKPAPPRPPG